MTTLAKDKLSAAAALKVSLYSVLIKKMRVIIIALSAKQSDTILMKGIFI